MENEVVVAGLAALFSGSQIAVEPTSRTFLSISFPSHHLLDSHSEKVAGCSLWCEFLGRWHCQDQNSQIFHFTSITVCWWNDHGKVWSASSINNHRVSKMFTDNRQPLTSLWPLGRKSAILIPNSSCLFSLSPFSSLHFSSKPSFQALLQFPVPHHRQVAGYVGENCKTLFTGNKSPLSDLWISVCTVLSGESSVLLVIYKVQHLLLFYMSVNKTTLRKLKFLVVFCCSFLNPWSNWEGFLYSFCVSVRKLTGVFFKISTFIITRRWG